MKFEQEIADYCKSDVINTYRLWLRHELFRGRMDHAQFEFSERDVTRVAGSAADQAAGWCPVLGVKPKTYAWRENFAF